MAISEVATNTTTPGSLGAEVTLYDANASGIFVFVVDATAMINGDVLEVRIYSNARTAGTVALTYYASFYCVQGYPVKYSVPVPIAHHLKVTITQTAGTLEAYPWSLLQIDT